MADSNSKCCSVCGQTKLLSDFTKDRSRPTGIKSCCKECNRLRVFRYAQTRREAQVDRAKKWYRENKDRKAEYDREWRKGYAKKKRDALLAKANARRRRARGATPAWADKKAILAIYAMAREMKVKTGLDWHVDHIVPLISPLVSGFHCESNLRIVPASENTGKGNRWWPDMP